MLEINGIKCFDCETIIFSRTRHDFHWCPCGKIAIDGGFDYLKYSYKDMPPIPIKFSLEITKKELYNDWNYNRDLFGLIKKEDQTMKIIEVSLEKQER